jgi:predicted dehydrogenase
MVRQFERGVREGYSPSPNFTDGVHVQAVLDAARESSEQGGKTVVLAQA